MEERKMEPGDNNVGILFLGAHIGVITGFNKLKNKTNK